MSAYWLRSALLALVTAALLAGSPAWAAGTVSLDGKWSFVTDPGGKLTVADLASASSARDAQVPGSWQAEFDDLRDYAGVAWYWRTFSEAAPPESGNVLLVKFGAVDYRAEVYVNGHKAGEHDGGYLPFEINVTPWVRAGDNQVAVRVADPGTKPEVEGIRFDEIPHGKQNWYVQTSGLWQSVSLEDRPDVRVDWLHIRAGADGRFTIDLRVNGTPAGPASGADVRIKDATGVVVWTQSLKVAQNRASASGTLANPQLWNPGSPYLYTVEASLGSGDTASSTFGFRTLETKGGKFYLNGRVIYLRGALDQDFYPDTVYTPPSLDYLKQEMTEAKAIGLNMLRCHIKVPDPRYLEAADAVGMLVWYEIPNWDKLTPDSERRGHETLEGMSARDWNHPSIVIVSLINESWGVDLKQAPQREWLKGFYNQAKGMVPGWLVEDNSACCDNFHVAGDLADTHEYDSIPGAASDFDRFVAELARRPNSLGSPYGDAQLKPDAPLMLSEFGNWGLPHLPEILPWWFSRGFGDREITTPGGLADRFREFGYNKVFPSLAALTDATGEHEYESLKYEVESLRMHPEIQGYIVTEFTDVNWEANGLFDIWRHPKSAAIKLGPLQGNDLILARTSKRNYTSGEKVHVDLFFSHYSTQPLAGASLRWGIAGAAENQARDLPSADPGSVVPAGSIDFTAPAVTTPLRRMLQFSVVSGGRPVSENSLEFFFYPPPGSEFRPAVAFDDAAGRLRRLSDAMHSHGYLQPSGDEAMPVMIASSLGAKSQAWLKNGGRVILIASDKQTLAPGIEVVPRAGSDLDGNWITNFLWIRKDHPIFHAIGFSPVQGFEAQAVDPPAVIRGIPSSAFESVVAGVFYGWLHNDSGLILEARVGKGKLIATTYRLAETYGTDPYGTALLDAMVERLLSNNQPAFELPVGP